MTDKTKPTEIADTDLDVSAGLQIKGASTSGNIELDRTTGFRKNGIRVGGIRVPGARKDGSTDFGVRVPGFRKPGNT